MSKEIKCYCDCCGKDISNPKDKFDKKYHLGFKVSKTYFKAVDNFWQDGEWTPAKGYENLELCEECFLNIGRLVEKQRAMKAKPHKADPTPRDTVNKFLNRLEEMFDKGELSYICLNLDEALERSWHLSKLHKALERCKDIQGNNLESFVLLPVPSEIFQELAELKEEE